MSNDRPLEDAVHELSARCQRNGRDALARAMLETAIDRVTMAMSPPPGAREAVARARHIMGEIDDDANTRTFRALKNDGRFRRHASGLYTRVDYTANGTNRVPAEDEAQGQ